MGGMADETNPVLFHLTAARDTARHNFFMHRNAGNLTPSQRIAWHYRDMALLLFFKAAQLELEAETEIQVLLATEAA